MEKRSTKPTIKSILIGFFIGFIVLLLLNKFWVKSEHYIVHSIVTAVLVAVVITLMNLVTSKRKNKE
jgi:multisubunit Na+/H+ antiporter MnhE subunit